MDDTKLFWSAETGCCNVRRKWVSGECHDAGFGQMTAISVIDEQGCREAIENVVSPCSYYAVVCVCIAGRIAEITVYRHMTRVTTSAETLG